MNVHIVFISLALMFFIGCSAIKTTTTTETASVNIPAKSASGSAQIKIKLPIDSTIADSIGRAYLKRFCKGTLTTEQNGLKSVTEFHTEDVSGTSQNISNTQTIQTPPSKKPDLVIQANTKIEAAAQIIPADVKKTVVEQTPSQLWILWNSKQFWITTFILGAGGMYVKNKILKV
ncbi:MAG: hypothetical protein ABR936_11970 [Bacteroidota bacterium]